MTAYMRHHGSRRIKGFSLIELMVSLTIGLLITIAIFSTYLGASAASKMADAQGRMNEDAQAALLILSQQLKMAGNNPDQAGRVDDADPTLSSRRNPVYGATSYPTGSYTTSNFFIRGCDGQFSNMTSASSLDKLDCSNSGSALPDAIAISYEADSFNTIPTSQATGKSSTDCLGKKLDTITAVLPTVVGSGTASTTVTYAVAGNEFYVASSTPLGSPSLYCKGNGMASTPQVLVENVEDLQFTYGAIDSTTSATTATVAGYLRADELAALTSVTNSAMPWSKVLAVRICILIRSEGQVLSADSQTRYLDCAGSLVNTPPDRRLRQAYFATVVLRNRRL